MPLGPTIAQASPSATVNVASCTATTFPYATDRFRTASATPAPGALSARRSACAPRPVAPSAGGASVGGHDAVLRGLRTAPSGSGRTSRWYTDSQPTSAGRAGGSAASAALPLGQLVGRDVQVGGPAGDVDPDHVAVPDQRQRPARGRLGRHLADHDALVHQAGQLPVGDHRDLAGQPGPVQREHEPGGHAHAGRAGDALAAQHHDLPGRGSGRP